MSDRRTIEARTIRTLADLRIFVDDCIASADAIAEGRYAGLVRLSKPLDLRLSATTYADGSTAYDLDATRW